MKTFSPSAEPLEPRSLLSVTAPATPVNPVIAWNAVALDAIRADRSAPPQASRALAIVQTSVYDAVNSVVPTGARYLVKQPVPAGTSVDAAAVGAAYQALALLYPAQTPLFRTALGRSLAALGSAPGVANGFALGVAVAGREFAARAADGSAATVTYTPGTKPGQWRPTPPALAPALDPQWGAVRPFVLPSGSQFRPTGPPPLTSPRYATGLDVVATLGARNSPNRTPDQTRIALFWADGAGTATPPGHWNEIAEQLATSRRDSTVTDARLFARLDLALADAAIACWDAKYAYNFWRPVTAIQSADPATSPGTVHDPSWAPLLTTPPFPTYVSGHSTFSAAAAVVLAAEFGRNVPFTTTSDALPGVTRSFPSFNAAAAEAGISRIYAGIHFPFDNTDGQDLGANVGRYVVHHALRPGRP